MPQANFVYTELSDAEHDLKLFSRMNMHEDKPLYLNNTAEGMVISDKPARADLISSIALNGILFTVQK